MPSRARQRFAIIAACSLACACPAGANDAASPDAYAYLDAAGGRAAILDAYRAALAPAAAQEGEGQAAGYRWRGGPPPQPDWRGAGRDAGYFLGYQFAAIAALYVAPESVSGWDSEDKKHYSFSKWSDNVSKPVWDEDRWWINYILHPYWGGAYYIRGRERGLDRTQAFWYSALLSTLFEYGAEALYEPVSIQDVFVTPIVGYFVGEYLFAPWRERIRAKPDSLGWQDKTALFLTDPLGVLNAETDRLLGVKTAMQWQLVDMRARVLPDVGGMGVHHPAGLSGGASPLWGLQLRVDW